MTTWREQLERRTALALPTRPLAHRVRRVEEAARENALLARRLEEQVARLEQSLVPLLEIVVQRGSRD